MKIIETNQPHRQFRTSFGVSVQGRVKTRIMSAGGIILKESPWQKNLMLDQGLNALARSTANSLQCTPASVATYIQVGSGTNANSFASGAITFTQAGTTLTASAGFFTAGMVGGLFKWGLGTAGVEVYITAFTSTTQVTVGTSATVAVPDVGTVWMVQQTALQTFAFTSNTYQTNAGDCQTTQVSNTLLMKRTYIIPQQASPYTVNEIGYSSTSTTTRCCGRIKLASSDVVGTSNFYVVILEITFTFSPSAPAASANVGTNIDTTGTIMLERFDAYQTINTGTGAVVNPAIGACSLDGSVSVQAFMWPTATYTQNASIQAASSPLWSTVLQPASNVGWVVASPAVVGKMTITLSTGVSAAGQTLHGMGLGKNSLNNPALDIKFTTPVTAPTGTFQPISVWSGTYGRTLNNV